MERIMNAIETIEANAVRMFGFEDGRAKEIFKATEYIRIMFALQEENEEENSVEEVIVFNEDDLTFKKLLEMEENGEDIFSYLA